MADSGAQQRKHRASPPRLSLFSSLCLCMWQNSTIYLSQKSMLGTHLIFIASFDSNDFKKPLILARSPWLQHRRVSLLISDSISREQCTAVAPDTYMPLKRAGNLFSPRCSSSWCNSHSDKNPSLWYLATKWEEGYRKGEEGDHIFCDQNQKGEDGNQAGLEHPNATLRPLEHQKWALGGKNNSLAEIWTYIKPSSPAKSSFSERGLSTSKLSTI